MNFGGSVNTGPMAHSLCRVTSEDGTLSLPFLQNRNWNASASLRAYKLMNFGGSVNTGPMAHSLCRVTSEDGTLTLPPNQAGVDALRPSPNPSQREGNPIN